MVLIAVVLHVYAVILVHFDLRKMSTFSIEKCHWNRPVNVLGFESDKM
jgi:hypothetical protein